MVAGSGRGRFTGSKAGSSNRSRCTGPKWSPEAEYDVLDAGISVDATVVETVPRRFTPRAGMSGRLPTKPW